MIISTNCQYNIDALYIKVQSTMPTELQATYEHIYHLRHRLSGHFFEISTSSLLA